MMETVLEYGTGKAAAIGQFAAGKTGTTSNYGDAWFVGWDSKYTVAVWVGYPNKLIPMTTDFDGGPVVGGTFPALIWHEFMMSALQIEKERSEEGAAKAAARDHTGASRTRLRACNCDGAGHRARPPPPRPTASRRRPGRRERKSEGAGTAAPEHAAAPPHGGTRP